MTLGQFFENVSTSPSLVLFYFIMLPVTALLAWIFGKGVGLNSPWKYLYSCLIYLACIPGIFAISLNVYLFLFERKSILDMNILTQILPIISMLCTILLIRRNVSLRYIPGFGTMTNLVTIISVIIGMMWILEKSHIIIFSYLPLWQFILMFIGALLIIRLSWKRMMS